MIQKHKTQLSVAAVAVAVVLISSYINLPNFADADLDGIPDSSDNCLNAPNPMQTDFDADSIGDECDLDDDNDKVLDVIDAFDNNPTEWADFDFDGMGTQKDPDDDNDGILDIHDPIPILPTEQLAKKYLKEIQDCVLFDSKVLSISCYSQFFKNVIKQEESISGPLHLSVALSKLGAIQDCHFISHVIGHAAFEENSDIFEILGGIDGSICRGAFYHGSIAAYFNELKENGHPSATSNVDLCETFYGTSNYQDCIHGLGHGFVLYFSNELMPAVEACNQMSFYENQICVKGVMMQYIDNQVNEHDATSENLSNMCPQSELSSQDYQQCVMSIGTAFAFRSFHNFEVASKFCELIEDEKDKEFCLQGLELEIQDSEKYKIAPLNQEIREKFQPKTVKLGSKELIVDIRSPAIISEFTYVEETKMIMFSFDKPSYIIMYIPNDLLPKKLVLTVNGVVPHDVMMDSKQIKGYTTVQIVPKTAGIVIFTPV